MGMRRRPLSFRAARRKASAGGTAPMRTNILHGRIDLGKRFSRARASDFDEILSPSGISRVFLKDEPGTAFGAPGHLPAIPVTKVS